MDEPTPELIFDKPYLLAMANAGPGHQRLAVLHHCGPTPWPNFKHTIFGEVADQASRDVVDAIGTTPTGPRRQPDRPGGHRDRRDRPPTDQYCDAPTPGRGADLLSAPRPGVRTSAASLATGRSARTACATRRWASSARPAWRRARRPRAAPGRRTAACAPRTPSITTGVLIGINAGVWLSILLTGGSGSRLVDIPGAAAQRPVPGWATAASTSHECDFCTANGGEWLPGGRRRCLLALLTSGFTHVACCTSSSTCSPSICSARSSSSRSVGPVPGAVPVLFDCSVWSVRICIFLSVKLF